MKKLILCSLLFISIHAFSQVSVGLTGGFLRSVHEYKDSLPTPNRGSKLGIEVLIEINNKWNLRTGVEYISYSFVQFQPAHLSRPLSFTDNTQYYYSHYIGIPIGMRYVFFPEAKLKPFIDCSVTFMGNTSYKTTMPNNIDAITLSNPAPRSFIVSPALGIGVSCKPTEKIYISFMMNYNYQTSYMYNMPNMKSEMKKVRYNSINASLSLGYNF